MKIISILVMVSLVLMSCAHGRQPPSSPHVYKVPKDDKTPAYDDDRIHTCQLPKPSSGFDLGPLGVLMFPIIIGVMVWAFIYGFQKSMDNIWFNPNALFP